MLLFYIIIVIIAFLAGYIIGNGPPGEAGKAERVRETEISAAEEDIAFNDLLGYNADIAYGVRK